MKEIYCNGTVVTMEDARPTVSALAAEDGRILALGTEAELFAAYPGARPVDLGGGALLPAFIDAHSHFSSVASGLLQVSLAGCADLEAVCKTIRAFARSGAVEAGGWITVKDYDPEALVPPRRLDAALLDRAAPEHPVIVQHKCGHTGVCNSRALRCLGLGPQTPDPAGGRYGRREDGTLSGYLEENAFFENIRKIPAPAPAALLDAYRRAQQLYASYGITTLQEGMMVPQIAPLHRLLLKQDVLRLDLVSYPEFSAAEELYAAFADYAAGYRSHYRLGGIKVFLDGSPQEHTAWMRPQSAYLPLKPGAPRETGSGTLPTPVLKQALAWAAEHGVQLLAHCNGDAAAAQFLSAVADTERRWPDFARLRPVMIHAQFLAADQLSQVRRCGVLPSFFVAHVYHWGDVHLRSFGARRAASISPAADALRAGIPFTFHQDAPVIPPDMLETVWCAVNRVTRSGAVLGPGERISVWEALRAVTASAAYQYGEEARKGTLAPGKDADLVLLDRSPLSVLPQELRTLRVVRTIKAGQTVFAAGQG